MTEQEMKDFVTKNVASQGDEGAIAISRLLYAMIEKMHQEAITGVAPIVVNIGVDAVVEGTRSTYEVTTPQELIDVFIDEANEDREKTRLFVEDKGALIGFNFLEIDADSITGKVVNTDGEFCIVISKQVGHSYFCHEERIMALPQVTEGEVQAYKALFNASYDKNENKYSLIVGATEIKLTPAEMIIVNEEYNKASTDGNYTALWANSIAKYICCPEWFEGFQAFNLHSAFYNSKDLIFIDLHTPVLNVSNLTSTFEGCSRLEKISGILDVTNARVLTDAFKGCSTLQVFKMHGLATNLDLSDCPMLAYEVFEELITYSTMQRIVLDVHPATKNKIDNDTSWRDVKSMIDRSVNITVQVK